MTDKTRIAIAAVTTAGFLGGISFLGLTAGSDEPEAGGQVAAQTTTATVAEPDGSGGALADAAPRAAAPAPAAPAPARVPAVESGDDDWDDEDGDRDEDEHGEYDGEDDD